MSRQWFMAPFQHLLHDHRLWGISRRNVVPAFALGLFVAFLPTPGHTLIGALLALAARVNIPVAALTTWVSNPLTLGFMYYGAYRLGLALMGLPAPAQFDFELSWHWLSTSFVAVWQPMLLGCLLLGGIASILGYLGLDLLWRNSLADYKSRRAGRRDQGG